MHTQNDFEYIFSVYKRYIYPSNYPFIICEKWNYIRYASHKKIFDMEIYDFWENMINELENHNLYCHL